MINRCGNTIDRKQATETPRTVIGRVSHSSRNHMITIVTLNPNGCAFLSESWGYRCMAGLPVSHPGWSRDLAQAIVLRGRDAG